jgi:hypothetical protein
LNRGALPGNGIPEGLESGVVNDFGQDFCVRQFGRTERTVSAVQFVKDDSKGINVAFLCTARLVVRDEGILQAEQFRSFVQQICSTKNVL